MYILMYCYSPLPKGCLEGDKRYDHLVYCPYVSYVPEKEIVALTYRKQHDLRNYTQRAGILPTGEMKKRNKISSVPTPHHSLAMKLCSWHSPLLKQTRVSVVAPLHTAWVVCAPVCPFVRLSITILIVFIYKPPQRDGHWSLWVLGSHYGYYGMESGKFF